MTIDPRTGSRANRVTNNMCLHVKACVCVCVSLSEVHQAYGSRETTREKTNESESCRRVL